MAHATSPALITQAEKEGQSAFRIGVPVEHNPYEAGTDEYDAWERSWECEKASSTQPKA